MKSSPALVAVAVVLALPLFMSVAALWGLIFGALGKVLPGPWLTPVTFALAGAVIYAIRRFSRPKQPTA